MIYTYDILLNWTEELRLKEFYEWSLDDDLEHIKKIPLIRVSDNFIKDLLVSKIKLDKNFLIKIKDRAEGYFHNDIDIIDYAVIVASSKKALALELDEDGVILYKSSLLLDEEEEVLEMIEELKTTEVNYEILKRNKNINYLTRKEEKEKNFLLKEINKIKVNKEDAKLNYLYQEFFEEIEDGFDKKLKKLDEEVKKDNSSFNSKLFNLLKLATIKKK